MLYLIGLGLNDEKDITLKGLDAIKGCSEVYLEYYTSKLACDIEKLEELYEKKITIADREMIEQRFEKEVLPRAKEEDIAVLIIGDVFGATTHTAIMISAREQGIDVEVIHNASVLTAVGITGLELYKFGKTTSIPFNNDDVTAPIKVFEENQRSGLHTLFLLDLHPGEGRFMTVDQASAYLIKKGIEAGIAEETKAVACAGLGSKNPQIRYCELSDIQTKKIKLDLFPQCLIIPGQLHFVEEDALLKLDISN